MICNKKIALITGSSRGLGLAIAMELAHHDVQIILTGRDRSVLDQAKTYLKPNNHITIALDFNDSEQIEDFTKTLISQNITPNILIHNVGGVVQGDVFPLDMAVLFRSLHLNLNVAIKINEAFSPFLIKKREGRMIHIGSDASLSGQASPAYVIAKSALNGYVKSCARYYAQHNIMACSVLPGILEHEGSSWAIKKIQQPNYYQEKLKQMPLGRFGQPQEIAHFVSSLALSESMMSSGGLFEFCGANR